MRPAAGGRRVQQAKQMIGQGHQIFRDELQRFASETGDSRCAAIANRLAAPLRVAVAGRRGVGRTTVAHALARVGQSRGTITVTGRPDADVGVYVIAEVVKPEDRAAITAITKAGRPVMPVLNKADLIAPTQPGCHPDGPTSAARTHCAQLCARTGVSIEPVVGLLAVAALDDLVDDAMWAALQALARQQPVADGVRRRLLDTLDVFGIEQALAAIRGGATREQSRAVLRRLSCIDDIVDNAEAVGAQVRYQRVLDAVADLQTLAVTDQEVGDFLTRDATVVARMAAAVDVVEAAGIHVDRCEGAAAYLRRAAGWQRYSRGPVASLHRACGADIVRGSLRLWSRVGSRT
jgi:energy-coupling factor transporter ATP-binding protein EcfA2